MANNEDIKGIQTESGGFDFGDEWLADLEEVFDFDLQAPSEKAEKAPEAGGRRGAVEASASEGGVTPELEKAEPEEIEVSLDEPVVDERAVGAAAGCGTSSGVEAGRESKEEAFLDSGDELALIVEVEEEPEVRSGSEKRGTVTTQTLDVASLQRRLSARNHKQASTAQSKACEEAQFITLILMRLFDDLELLILQKHTEEVVDLAKQFNRLANIISFCDMGALLPMFGYITSMLPFSFSDAEIGEMSVRRFDAQKLRRFLEKSVEILNCLMFLLRLLAKRYSTFDTSRFADTLERLYGAFEAVPGEPSLEAPLPMSDSRTPSELTTRTFAKIARTVEALSTESLHYIESSSRYGCKTGYADAAKSLNNAAQVANEYKFADLSQTLTAIYEVVNRQPEPNPVRDVDVSINSPSRQLPPVIFKHYEKLGDLIRTHFASVISEKKLLHYKELLLKLESAQEEGLSKVRPLTVRWHAFVEAARPHFSLVNPKNEDQREQLSALYAASKRYEINWLADVFAKLEKFWVSYPDSCAEALTFLGNDILSFPTSDITDDDLEQLNHRRLRVLFERTLGTRPPQAYSVINRAREYVDTLFNQLEDPKLLNASVLEDILIDARNIGCKSLIRTCEVMLTLLDHLPSDPTVPVSESLTQGIYFCGGLFEDVTNKLFSHVSHSPTAPSLTSNKIFFESLLKLFQPQGRPRESVTYFIHKHLGDLIAELQLVWSNTTTQTSTQYYCSLLRKLLHTADLCGLQSVHRLIVAHLDDIPGQEFINVNDETLVRQYRRIVGGLRDAHLPEPLTNAGEEARQFFTKVVSVLNRLLKGPGVIDSSLITSELEQLSLRVTALGMSTEFPPIIAILRELRSIAQCSDANRDDLETLLYWVFNIAHNVCPTWKKPQQAELEFIKAPIAVPTSLFQQHLEHSRVIYDILKSRSDEDPVLMESAEALYSSLHNMTTYAPYGLELVLQNARNRCRYLKKSITITLDTNGYPSLDEIREDERVDDVVSTAFVTVIELIVNLFIDYAFGSTNGGSEIRIVLEPVTNSCSASILHNAHRLTNTEVLDALARVNLDPAPYDNILEMILGSKRLMKSYPPTQTLAYIQPILCQFSGRLDISNVADDFTSFFISFAL